ncbi:hypothetical protein WDW86_22735 [Bdellovibrionota bacterium FG-2]
MTDLFSRQIRIATLDQVYTNLSFWPLAELFAKMIQARTEGYRPEYPKQVIPFDMTDYVDCHHLFCFQDETSIHPFSSVKFGFLSRYDELNIALPLLSVLKYSQAPRHEFAVQKLLEDTRMSGEDLSYGAFFSISKKHRTERPLVELTRELLAAVLLNDWQNKNLRKVLVAAVLRFKTDRLYRGFGFKPLSFEGREVGPFHNRFMREEVELMVLDEPSEWVHQCSLKHQDLIAQRLIIGEIYPHFILNQEESERKAA